MAKLASRLRRKVHNARQSFSRHSSDDASAEKSIADCEFFQLLPYEIRLMIYDLAFTNKTIHLDLYHCDNHNNLQRPTRVPALFASDNFPNSLPWDDWWERGSYDKDTKRCRCHCWHTTICHRLPTTEFYLDRCGVRGETWNRTGEAPKNLDKIHFLGMLGWLLSCRFAYNDTIDLIYKNNTYHVDNLSFLSPGRNRNAPRKLLPTLSQPRLLYFPPRMSTITSLEVVCNLLLRITLGQYNNHKHWEEYEFMIHSIPNFFTCLRRLDVSVHPTDSFIDDDVRAEQQIIRGHEARLLQPIDTLRQCYGTTLVHLALAVPVSHHSRFMKKAIEGGASKEIVGEGRTSFSQYWREVKTQGDAGFQEGPLGYWIREGVDNTPTNAARMH